MLNQLPKLDVAGSTPVARSREVEELAPSRYEPRAGGGSLVAVGSGSSTELVSGLFCDSGARGVGGACSGGTVTVPVEASSPLVPPPDSLDGWTSDDFACSPSDLGLGEELDAGVGFAASPYAGGESIADSTQRTA